MVWCISPVIHVRLRGSWFSAAGREQDCFLRVVEECGDVSFIVNRVLHSRSGGLEHPGGTRRETVGPQCAELQGRREPQRTSSR